MRISPTDIRCAITDPTYRVPTERNGGPSADGTLRKAIRVYHEHGLEAAMAHIEGGLTKAYWHEKGGLTQAKAVRQMLDTYIDLASRDNRPTAPATRYTIRALGHEINADVDVIVKDSRGYVGRLCFTANLGRRLTRSEQALIVAAPFKGLADELDGGLFDDLVVEIELWELRLGTIATIGRDVIEAAWPQLLEHLKRATALLGE
jgi:hypothetical protein